jgi:CBS domain-containing protein
MLHENKDKTIVSLVAKDIMTYRILKVQEDWSLQRLIQFFLENSISGAPVVSKNGKLVGVVSLTDIVQQDAFCNKDFDTCDPHEYYIHNLEVQFAKEEISSFQIKEEPKITVYDIMTPTIFQVTENTPIQDVADTMIKGHIHRVFVTREEKLLGVISTLDLLKIVRDLNGQKGSRQFPRRFGWEN